MDMGDQATLNTIIILTSTGIIAYTVISLVSKVIEYLGE